MATKTNYGQVVDNYTLYKQNPEIAEWRLGHEPLLKLLGELGHKRVLDFGCGPANFTHILSERGARVSGVDADREVIERAQLKDPRGDYRVHRGLLAREFDGTKFDAIIATFSFCLVPDRELRYVLRDMRQLLKATGKLYVVEPNQQRAHGIQYANLHYHAKEGVKSGDYVHVTLGNGEYAIELYDDIYRTHADYRELLAEADFKIDVFEEPRPEPDWEGNWQLEDQYPPFLLITAR